MAGARNEGAGFFRIGIHHQRESPGICAELVNERRCLAGASPNGHPQAAGRQRIQLPTDPYSIDLGLPTERQRSLSAPNGRGLQLHQGIDHLPIVAMPQFQDVPGPLHQAQEGLRGEVRDMLVEEVSQSLRLEYPVDAGHFGEQPAGLVERQRPPGQAIDQGGGVGQVFQHMPDGHGIRRKRGHVLQRLEIPCMELQAAPALRGCVGVEADETAFALAAFGQPTDEMSFATADIDHRRLVAQMPQEQIARCGQMPLPDPPFVEHPIRIVLIGNRLIGKRAVPDMGAARALHEVMGIFGHTLRLVRAARPAQGRQRLLPPTEKGYRNAVLANGTRGLDQFDIHAATTFLK
ncbi:hypothetical protein D3C78_1012700 [compost metagenome]